ncbi:MAG: hypothetical protein ACJAZO_002007 [Myxococcota bacterium]
MAAFFRLVGDAGMGPHLAECVCVWTKGGTRAVICATGSYHLANQLGNRCSDAVTTARRMDRPHSLNQSFAVHLFSQAPLSTAGWAFDDLSVSIAFVTNASEQLLEPLTGRYEWRLWPLDGGLASIF